MGAAGKGPNNAPDADEAKQPQTGSVLRQQGRRLTLAFRGGDKPELHKVEFHYNQASRAATFEQGVDAYFSWSPVPQALSLFFLDYLYNASLNPHRRFVFRGAVKGSLAASLSNARYTNSSFIHDLFVNRPVGGGKDPCLKEVIQGRADKDDPGAFARCR